MVESYLGFDYSRRKIGIATGQSLTNTATALNTLTSNAGVPDWPGIALIIEQWKPVALVVGLPLNMDGSEQESTQLAKEFGLQLEEKCHLPVYYMDERLSSREASHILGYDGHTSPRRTSRPGKKVKKKNRDGQDIDCIAAQLILQSWLNSQ